MLALLLGVALGEKYAVVGPQVSHWRKGIMEVRALLMTGGESGGGPKKHYLVFFLGKGKHIKGLNYRKTHYVLY